MQISEKARFVFLWGVLGWGFSTALAITLFDWFKNQHFDTPVRIAGRFLIFMALGIPFGLRMWSGRGTLGPRKMTRAHQIGRMVLFVGLMFGLLFVLFRYL
jgi:hypothetical protein